MSQAATGLLQEKGYISFVDVLMRMGKLSREDHEAWRNRKVFYLERVIKINLAQVNHLLRTLQQNSAKGGLKASKTAYMSWGKGKKTALRFSKSGDPNLEAAYATHFLRKQKNPDSSDSPQEKTNQSGKESVENTELPTTNHANATNETRT